MSSKLRSLFIIVIVLGSSIPCFAQNSIKGSVIDENGDPLTYAAVVLLSPADSTVQYFDVADNEGYYHIQNIKPGNYLMQYSFVGMEVIYEKVAIPSDLGEDFGDKMMKVDIMVTDEVVVLAERIPIQIRTDTVAFDARAFKTKPGAVVEDLLKKLPGVEVDKAGNIKALGEDVTKVLVDGKEFFGNDPKVATKNLPADAIDEVQVYDKKSEMAEFMGIDDGVLDRTINLLLNEDSKKGYFGKEQLGGGTGNHYKTGGQIFRFLSKFQSALLGMYNNVNEFRFSAQGTNEFGQVVNGLNTTAGGGINLSYNATGSNRYFISYLGSTTKRNLERNTSTENFLEDGSYFQDADLDNDTRSTPDRINFGVRHNFHNKQYLNIDGNLNINSNNGVSQVLTNTSLNDSLISNLDNISNNKSDITNFNVKGGYVVKLNGNDTQLKTDMSTSYNKNTSGLDWTNITTIYDPGIVIIDNNYQDNINENLGFSVNPTLVQKITPFWYLNAGAQIGLNDNHLDRKVGIFKQDGAFIDSLSAEFSTNVSFVRPSLSLQRNAKKSNVNFILRTSWTQFDKVLHNSSIGKSNYFYLLPSFNYRYNYREGRRIELRYGTSANMPGLNQLLPVVNTVNKLSLYQGNINLKPEYRHNVTLQWSVFDAFSFTSLFTRLTFGYTKDKISGSKTINDDFTQFNTPVNVPYNYNASANIDFSTPIRALGINVNVWSNENWSKGISLINSEDNIQTTFTHSLDLSFENRSAEDLNITVGGYVSVTDAKFSIAESMNNVFFDTEYYVDILFTPNEQWSFFTESYIVYYGAKSFKKAVSIPVINASISYHFLEGRKAGIILQGSDLLDKYSGFLRTSGPNYLMEQKTNNIGRYVMLTFNLGIGTGGAKGGGR